MMLPDFKLERYLAAHEFTAPFLLSSSDCESLSIKELLAYEPAAATELENLWLGYTEAPGHPALRKQVTALYEKVSADQVLVHAGAEEAIFNFMNVVLSPGDHLVVHWPCYQSLFQVAASIGCEVTKWEADADRGWEVTSGQLEKLIRPNTKAVILNTPHNPTGFLMKAAVLREVAALVESRGAILFVDEVYRGLEYDERDRLPSACDLSPTAVSLGVMSKAYGLAGLRIGWVATRNQILLEKMTSYKDYTSICNSGPSELLATVALKHGVALVRRNREIIAANLKAADTLFSTYAHLLEWHRPKAGCIAFPKWKGKGTSAEFCRAVLESTGVLLADSSLFLGGERHFRLGFGRRNFAEGLGRLSDFLSAF